jgi:peptidoglycan/xylan/chitin deacetylase (PgdA/CDA1 family)
MNANSTRKDLTVPVDSFTNEVKWLAENNYTSISLGDIYLYSQGKFSLPKKPVVFTFDDGYSDVFQNAIPILKQYGFTASFAIISQWPGQTIGTNIYANWDAIKVAREQGMEIVCHTQNHFDGTNPKFSADYIFSNLTGCKNDLAGQGVATNVLIYPYGHYNPAYIEQASKAGFIMGITVHEGDTINLDNLIEIPRLRVHGAETLQRFEDIILDKPHTSTSTSTPAKISG